MVFVFSNQKSQFGKILDGLAMEDVGIVYGHLVYFMAIWSILFPFGMFYGHFGRFFSCWYVVSRKIWQPWPWQLSGLIRSAPE
jgi:hypothetical protein